MRTEYLQLIVSRLLLSSCQRISLNNLCIFSKGCHLCHSWRWCPFAACDIACRWRRHQRQDIRSFAPRHEDCTSKQNAHSRMALKDTYVRLHIGCGNLGRDVHRIAGMIIATHIVRILFELNVPNISMAWLLQACVLLPECWQSAQWQWQRLTKTSMG